MVFRVTAAEREGVIPPLPPLTMPLLLYQARLGEEQEEARGPSISLLCHLYILLLSVPLHSALLIFPGSWVSW